MSLRGDHRLYSGYGNVISVEPAVEPVDADELRKFLRETADGLPDYEADELITSARQMVEGVIGIALIYQTWTMTLDRWPVRSRSVYLPRYPLSEVTGVTLYSEDGTSDAVVIDDVFNIDTTRAKGRLVLKSGAAWPVPGRSINSIEITYISGFGPAASDVPEPLRRSVKMVAAHLHTNRGDGCDAGSAVNGSGAWQIVSAYRVARI